MDAELLTTREVAKLLRCGRSRVFELIARGELPSLRLGRCRVVRREDLAVLIERRIEAERKAAGL